jgi:hypothetical protein
LLSQELSTRHKALSQLYPKAGSIMRGQMAFPSMVQQQQQQQQQHDAIGHSAATAKSGASVTGMRASVDSGFPAAGDVCPILVTSNVLSVNYVRYSSRSCVLVQAMPSMAPFPGSPRCHLSRKRPHLHLWPQQHQVAIWLTAIAKGCMEGLGLLPCIKLVLRVYSNSSSSYFKPCWTAKSVTPSLRAEAGTKELVLKLRRSRTACPST